MDKIKESFVAQINEKIPIYELVLKSGVVLKKQGKNFMGLCPFHQEKTPSFSVSKEKNIAFCMSCSKGGKPVTYWRQLKNISTETAVEELCEQFHIDLPKQKKNNKDVLYDVLNSAQQYFHDSLLYIIDNIKDHPLERYLFQERKLTLELIKEFGLGYAYDDFNSLKDYLLEKGFSAKTLLKLGLIKQRSNNEKEYYNFFVDRLMFPLTDEKGNIVGFSGRLIKEKEKYPKYLFNSETALFKKSNLLYRLYQHQEDIQTKNEIILTEGVFDVIAFYKKGIKNVVATLGTSFTEQHAKLLQSRSQNCLIIYDSDNAGKEAALKISTLLIKRNFKIKIVTLPDNLDPDQYILQKNIINLSSLKEKAKDFVFYNVEEWKEQNQSDDEIESKTVTLLKYYDLETKRYYAKELYKKYQISLNLAEQTYDKENNLFNDKKGYRFLSQIANDSDKFIHIKKMNKKQYNETDKHIIIEILLSDKFLPLIYEKRVIIFLHNSVLIDIVVKIKEYYEKHLPEENIHVNRHVDLDRFALLYEDFFQEKKAKFDFDLFKEDIENSFLFKQKKNLPHLEDVKILLSKKTQLDDLANIEKEITSLEKDLTQMISNEEDVRQIEEKGQQLIQKKLELHKVREKLAKL
ncbi:MAG: DNA primase [Candidatus Phytoplasma pruni]|nr:DNA primase [Candidatus Phytoplasma pruni]